MLVFLHIPKTAGQTMVPVLRRQFARGEVVNLNVEDASMTARTWRAVPSAQRARAKCVYGHLLLDPAMFGDKPANYITMLRDPVERSVSEYYYALRRPEHGLHRILRRERMTLDKFVTTDLVTQICNTQVRMLSAADGPVQSEKFLDRALDNLERHVMLAGLTERFDETLLLCRELLGWRRLFYERTNVNRKRPPLSQLPARTLAALESVNRLDRELYRHVYGKFEHLVRRHRISPGEIVALRRTSRLYGAVRRTLKLPLSVGRDVGTEIRSWWAIRG